MSLAVSWDYFDFFILTVSIISHIESPDASRESAIVSKVITIIPVVLVGSVGLKLQIPNVLFATKNVPEKISSPEIILQ